MAAPVYQHDSVMDAVRRILDRLPSQVISGDTSGWWDTDVLLEYIGVRVLSPQITNYQFIKVATEVKSSDGDTDATGMYVWAAKPRARVYLLGMSFTGLDDRTYKLKSSGSIVVTVGTETRDTLTVTGTPVDFGMLMYDILKDIAAPWSLKGNDSTRAGSQAALAVYQQIMDMAMVFQGAR